MENETNTDVNKVVFLFGDDIPPLTSPSAPAAFDEAWQGQFLREHLEREEYVLVSGIPVTTCVLTFRNGASIVGHSQAFEPGDYDEEEGRLQARASALMQFLPVMWYMYRESCCKVGL